MISYICTHIYTYSQFRVSKQPHSDVFRVEMKNTRLKKKRCPLCRPVHSIQKKSSWWFVPATRVCLFTLSAQHLCQADAAETSGRLAMQNRCPSLPHTHTHAYTHKCAWQQLPLGLYKEIIQAWLYHWDPVKQPPPLPISSHLLFSGKFIVEKRSAEKPGTPPFFLMYPSAGA